MTWRRRLVLIALGVQAVVALASAAGEVQGDVAAERAVIGRVNAIRRANGLAALELDRGAGRGRA